MSFDKCINLYKKDQNQDNRIYSSWTTLALIPIATVSLAYS